MKISDNVRKIWNSLSQDYADRGKVPDSLDVLLDFPAQLKAVGDLQKKRILDLGCGLGDKSHHFAVNGAAAVTGVDLAGEFVRMANEKYVAQNLKYVCGDLTDISEISEIQGQQFDIVTCFQAMSFSEDLTRSFVAVAEKLVSAGKFVVTFPSPLRFAVEKAERYQMPVAKAYYETGVYTYPASWNPELQMEHYLFKFSDILNASIAAGFALLRCDEPDLDQSSRVKYPHKAEWVDKYGGLVVFEFQKK